MWVRARIFAIFAPLKTFKVTQVIYVLSSVKLLSMYCRY